MTQNTDRSAKEGTTRSSERAPENSAAPRANKVARDLRVTSGLLTARAGRTLPGAFVQGVKNSLLNPRPLCVVTGPISAGNAARDFEFRRHGDHAPASREVFLDALVDMGAPTDLVASAETFSSFEEFWTDSPEGGHLAWLLARAAVGDTARRAVLLAVSQAATIAAGAVLQVGNGLFAQELGELAGTVEFFALGRGSVGADRWDARSADYAQWKADADLGHTRAARVEASAASVGLVLSEACRVLCNGDADPFASLVRTVVEASAAVDGEVIETFSLRSSADDVLPARQVIALERRSAWADRLRARFFAPPLLRGERTALAECALSRIPAEWAAAGFSVAEALEWIGYAECSWEPPRALSDDERRRVLADATRWRVEGVATAGVCQAWGLR